MISFAASVKKELTQLTVNKEEARAELSALIHMNGSLQIISRELSINAQTENAAIAQRIYTLLRDFFKCYGEVIVRKKMKLKKNNVYIVRVKTHVERLLEELGIMGEDSLWQIAPQGIISSEEAIRAYLRGAFLARGSVNNPETSSYHLEIYSEDQEQAKQLKKLMNSYKLNARLTDRRHGYIVYLKEAEKISDFLALIGTTQAILRFENVLVTRDMRNTVNRMVNCENANMNKTIDAATRQIRNIQRIQNSVGLAKLPEKLQEMAQVRLENPSATIKELGELIPSGPVSKSGVNHRLRRLNQIAEALKEE